MNVRQKSAQFVSAFIGLSTCFFQGHPCLSSSKGLQWSIFYFPFSFIMTILVLWMETWQGAIFLHYVSLKLIAIAKIPNRCGMEFDLLYWLLGKVSWALLGPFHSDGCYSTGKGDIARVLTVTKYIHSDYALRMWGNHQKCYHRLFEPIILSLIEG